VKIFITGGAGFIGANVAAHHLQHGDKVVVFDNLSRAGTEGNLEWLGQYGSGNLHFVKGDIRDSAALQATMSSDVDIVYHFAAQVAVTTSVRDPREDFEINALGTFNLLEAVRLRARDAIVLYASTNKVYGGMETVAIAEDETRYRYRDLPYGIREDQLLDFHSPYGCSKGTGDQYVRDYARIYGLRTVVMRQSCIYGTRQFGVEDQGWIAHFCISARLGNPISIYGDGKQARDALWIDDLVKAYRSAANRIDTTSGQIYNIGGGPEQAVSIWREFEPLLTELNGRPVAVTYADWRPGDQPVYISDIRKAQAELDWTPRVRFEDGLERLWRWVDANVHLFDTTAERAAV
jgi:CDP-paratose 2-epimerase